MPHPQDRIYDDAIPETGVAASLYGTGILILWDIQYTIRHSLNSDPYDDPLSEISRFIKLLGQTEET